MRQVGEIYPGNKNPFSYKYVQPEENGWISVKKFMPRNFDLVYLKMEDKIKEGWYTGLGWYGYKIIPTDEPIYWKRRPDEMD